MQQHPKSGRGPAAGWPSIAKGRAPAARAPAGAPGRSREAPKSGPGVSPQMWTHLGRNSRMPLRERRSRAAGSMTSDGPVIRFRRSVVGLFSTGGVPGLSSRGVVGLESAPLDAETMPSHPHSVHTDLRRSSPSRGARSCPSRDLRGARRAAPGGGARRPRPGGADRGRSATRSASARPSPPRPCARSWRTWCTPASATRWSASSTGATRSGSATTGPGSPIPAAPCCRASPRRGRTPAPSSAASAAASRSRTR